jgi:hypothetical protein
VVTKHHPDITEVQEQLLRVRWQRKKNGDGKRAESNYDEEFPPFDGEEWDPTVDSDSEEAKHVGNGKPCKFHNYPGGCHKSRCNFSHAPDDKSVRDELYVLKPPYVSLQILMALSGQNVCVDYLLGDCKCGQSCPYAHTAIYLLQGWWSTKEEVKAAKKLCDATNDPTANASTIAALENTSKFGRIKKAQGYRADLDLYSALSADVLKSRLKDKLQNKPTSSSQSSLFVLILCLQDEGLFNRTNGHLLKALGSKVKLVRARNATQAINSLDAPELVGVIASDAGIIDHKNSDVVPKLVQYVKCGGSAVFGCLFPSFIGSSEFSRFFTQNFGLRWEFGSYFRTTFSQNPANDLVKNNPSLSKSYSMKALHVKGVSPASALYKANVSSRTQSLVFPSVPVTDFNESPAVTTCLGNGFVSFLGDVNAEESSTKTILAMLGLLDAPLPSAPLPSAPLPSVPQQPEAPPQSLTTKKASGKKSGKKKNKTEQSSVPSTYTASPPPSPSPSVETSAASRRAEMSTSPDDRLFIMQLSLEYGYVVDNVCKQQLDALQVKVDVKKVTSESRAKELLRSPNLCGVFATDPGLTSPDYKNLLAALVRYVSGGGCLVFGGTFACFVQYPDVAPLFATFDLMWKAGSYTRNSLECNMDENELVEMNLFLPKKICIKGLFLDDVEMEEIVYTPTSGMTNSQNQSPIVFTHVGKGHVGYIGDVNADSCTTPSLLAMFDLLKPQRAAPKPQPHYFVLVLTHFDTLDEYEQTPLFRRLKEKNVDIVTDEGLFDPRLADLLSSRDILGVVVLDDIFSISEREWLGHQIAAYTWSGGTVVLAGDFGVMTPPDEFEGFLTDNFCLPWKISSATELSVRLNGDNPLIRRLPIAAQQQQVHYSEGAFIYDVGPEDVVYGSESGLGPERATHVPVAYARVGKGHVAYFGSEDISELDTTLMLAMMKL